MNDTTNIAERSAARAEKVRVLRLALASFVVECNTIARDLDRDGNYHMAAAVKSEIKTASDLLSECPNLVS
jgi:hypothetical protein